MLWLESNLPFATSVDAMKLIEQLENDNGFKKDEILYSLEKLQEVNYIIGGVIVTPTMGGNNYVNVGNVNEITWDGHEYLDNIRDPEIWKKTKNATSTFKSVSLSLMSNVANQVISSIVKKSLGL